MNTYAQSPMKKQAILLSILSMLFCRSATSDELSTVSELVRKIALETPSYLELIDSIKQYNCKDMSGKNDNDISFRRSFGKDEDGNGYTSCSIEASTDCQGGIFAAPLADDGDWLWIASRLRYIDYMTRMATRFGIPEYVIEPSLTHMKKIVSTATHNKINIKIRPRKIEKYGDSLGVVDDNEKYAEQRIAAEEELVTDWSNFFDAQPELRKLQIPSMTYGPECGAGETEVKLAFQPPGAKLLFISEFDWLLCKARGKDEWDDKICKGWAELSTPSLYLSGRYRYIATWAGGGTKKSVMDLSSSTYAQRCQTITIKADSNAEEKSVDVPEAQADLCLTE